MVKCIGFYVYHRSYLIWSPVIVAEAPTRSSALSRLTGLYSIKLKSGILRKSVSQYTQCQHIQYRSALKKVTHRKVSLKKLKILRKLSAQSVPTLQQQGSIKKVDPFLWLALAQGNIRCAPQYY